MGKKDLRGHIQNLAIAVLSLSALFLLTQLPLLHNIPLFHRVPSLFSPSPVSAGREEGALPAAMFSSVNLMVTGDGEYRRNGRLCVSAGDPELLQYIIPLFQEALGSAGSLEQSPDGGFRAALNGPGLYLELGGALPLEAAAAWLGMEEPLNFNLRLRAMALTTGGEEDVSLYLLEEGGGIFRCATALPVSALGSICEKYLPNGANFAFETAHSGLEPYAILTADSGGPLPDIQAELPAGYSAYNLLTALDFNAHTLSRYTESSGAEVVEETPRTLRIAPDGTVSLNSRWETASPLYQASGQGLREILAAAWRLASALTAGTGASPVYLHTVEETESGYTLRFGYQAAGVPVLFPDAGDALSVVYQNGVVTSFTYRCRVYEALEGEPAAMLPASMAQAIAAASPGSSLSIGYADDGSGQLAAQWLR